MAVEAQNFSNHSRMVPAFHGLLFGLILVALGYEVTMFVKQPAFGTAVGVMLAVGLLPRFRERKPKKRSFEWLAF